jgi:hypothetical protein
LQVLQRWKWLQSREAETLGVEVMAAFLFFSIFMLSDCFLIFAFSHYSSLPTISCFWHRDA